jgi:hypothetical protein
MSHFDKGMHFIEHFLEVNITGEEFLHLVNQNQSNDSQSRSILLIGLHTCGSLAATMLKLFVNCPTVTSFVGVGCCYYKGEPEAAYPLSDVVARLHLPLQREAFKMCCESRAQWEASTPEDQEYTIQRVR